LLFFSAVRGHQPAGRYGSPPARHGSSSPPPSRYSSPPPPFSPPLRAREQQATAPQRPPKNTTLHANNNEPAGWQHYSETLRIGSYSPQRQPVNTGGSTLMSPDVCPPLLLGRQSPLPHCNGDKATVSNAAAETGRRQMAAAPISNSDYGGGSNRDKIAGSPLVSGKQERLQSPAAAAPQEPVGKRAKQSLTETSSSCSKRKDVCNSSNNSCRQQLLLTVNPNYRSLSPSPPPPPRLPPPPPAAPAPGGADQEEDAAFPPPPSYGTLKRMTSYRR
jgi:hypothetical protein